MIHAHATHWQSWVSIPFGPVLNILAYSYLSIFIYSVCFCSCFHRWNYDWTIKNMIRNSVFITQSFSTAFSPWQFPVSTQALFWGRYFVPGVYLLIFNKYGTCLIKQNQQYPMSALVDLKDRPPKTLLASLPGNLGAGTRCRSSCSHTSYRWLRKRKSNPHCTQTFNENCIKSWTGWNHLQDQTCLLYGHKGSRTGRTLCVPGECIQPDAPWHPRSGREPRPSLLRARASILPSYLQRKITSL